MINESQHIGAVSAFLPIAFVPLRKLRGGFHNYRVYPILMFYMLGSVVFILVLKLRDLDYHTFRPRGGPFVSAWVSKIDSLRFPVSVAVKLTDF